MRAHLLILLVSVSFGTFAQTKLCIYQNREENIIEKYYALKADTQIKEGKYSAYTFFTNNLTCEGAYKNNLKDSIWKYYNWKGLVIDSGLYKNDKKYGIWQALNTDGKIQIKYDYSNKKIIAYNPQYNDTATMYKVINGPDTSFSFLQRPPIYLDGDLLMRNIIAEKVRFPLAARSAKIGGKVIISFIINNDGHVSDYKVDKPKGYGLDEAALYAVKQATGEWLPGQLNDKPVAVQYHIPVTFNYGN